MARIILKQSYQFTTPSGIKVPFYYDPAPQDVPDWVLDSPEFAALQKSEHVETVGGFVKQVPFVVNETPQPDPEAMAAHENRQMNAHVDSQNPPKAGEEAQLTEAELALKKSSGLDGPTGDWTVNGMDAKGFPVAKGGPDDVTATDAEKAAYAEAKKGK